MDPRLNFVALVVRNVAQSRLFYVERLGTIPFTLAHNVASSSDVDRVIAEAKAAGATIIAQPILREWGGYSGYFADPDGFR